MVPGNLNNDPWGEVFRVEVKKTGIPAMTGANYLEPDDFSKPFEQQRIHNSAFIFDGQGHELLRYYKRRLVAFGEYVPYARDYPCLAFIRSVTQDQYVPGEKPSTICEIAGYHAALTLCVEDIHPALAREAAFLGADTLFNLTNDGWFYQTHGPRAHMQAAAWRAIEVRRPLLRVTNTGRTVAVDPLGNIELIVPAETEAVGWTRLKRIDGGGADIVTPYMLLGEFWTAAIFAGVLGLALWVVLRNPMRPSA
jgi:apolipoprotein N-acyltransferase